MPPGPSPGSLSTGLTITNPLVLYRSLLATKCIAPDPAQHRLALHLQKLYHRLKDYEPAVDYKYQLDQLANSVELTRPAHPAVQYHGSQRQGRRMGILSSFREHKERAEALALTRKLTDQESAVQLESPQGLLLHGDVGTGKSMLVDLLADCLPNRKKRRWHYNTFMLENFAKLEQLRRSRVGIAVGQDEEHSLLWLARDMISTSPILFLDEFQLPDRVSSKILSSLLTSFFNLGGVLIATSNRMPEQLANASGVEFAIPPASRLGMLRHRWGGLLGPGSHGEESETVSPGKGDFAAFLDVLRARCQIWDMEGGKDWRRQEAEDVVPALSAACEEDGSPAKEQGFHGLQPMLPGNWGLGYEQSVGTSQHEQTMVTKGNSRLPKYYFTHPEDAAATRAKGSLHAWDATLRHAVADNHPSFGPTAAIPWKPASLRVYGRDLSIPRRLDGVSLWTFGELCVASLGPADYITLASNFHTFVVTDVPVLTLLDKNEARRLITLLDALYECRCRLLVRAAAGPDDIFFPESQSWSSSTAPGKDTDDAEPSDAVYSETFSEIFQDQTSPFRPNVSAYTSSASPPSYDSSPLPSSASPSAKATRSILADEDSDFGPTYGAGRSPGSRYRGPADGIPGAGNEIGQQPSPDFSRTGVFTGEDEKFAYKRATSRLWEMCGTRWWTKEEGWWKPLEKDVRSWENSLVMNSQRDAAVANTCASAEPNAQHNEGGGLFRHGASPFRTSQDPPPKIPWTHAWGMVKWGRKAGTWGQGIEGLDKRKAGSGHEGNTP